MGQTNPGYSLSQKNVNLFCSLAAGAYVLLSWRYLLKPNLPVDLSISAWGASWFVLVPVCLFALLSEEPASWPLGDVTLGHGHFITISILFLHESRVWTGWQWKQEKSWRGTTPERRLPLSGCVLKIRALDAELQRLLSLHIAKWLFPGKAKCVRRGMA